MPNLQDQIQALAPVAPPEVGVVSGERRRVGGSLTVELTGGAVTVAVSSGVRNRGAAVLDEPAFLSEVAAFNYVRAPGPLGRLFVEVTGPGGDTHTPTLVDMEATERAPGGFGPMSGRISEAVYEAHPDVYRQDARAVLYLESDNTCLHGGRIDEPIVAGGAVTIKSRGQADRAEKVASPVIYSTEDMSIWVPKIESLDAASNTENPWDVRVRTNAVNADVGSLEFTGPSAGDGADALAWLPGREIARMTFKAAVGSINVNNGALIEVWTFDYGWGFLDDRTGEVPDEGPNQINWHGQIGASSGEYVIDVDIDLTLNDGALIDPNGAGDNRGDPGDTGVAYVYPNAVQIEVSPDSDIGSPRPNLRVDITDIRLYGPATGVAFGRTKFSATELVMDLFGRMGIRPSDVRASSVNVLPYQLDGTMPYAEGLDFAALLTGWRWLIHHNGHRASYEWGPWDTRTWEVASPWAQLDVVGANRYNAAQIPVLYKDGKTVGIKRVRADPDPLDHRSFFGLVGLEHPARNDERAEDLGQRIVAELAARRSSAVFSIGEVIGPNGPTSGHHVFAGDTLDGSPRGAPGGLRVVRLKRRYDSVTGDCGNDFSAGSEITDIPVLARMLARRAKHTAA